MDTEIRNNLISAIRAGMDLDTPDSCSIDAEKCRSILQIAAKQSVLQIVCVGLKRMGAPAEVFKEYELSRLKAARRFVLQNDALDKISVALNDAQIPFIPLKGAVLRQLYPAPELRSSSDIDVLVK